MSEIKQTNFRIDENAANAFRKYCEDNGWNQAQGFDHLIEILELNKAKEAIPEQATDIEQFEMYQKKMLEAYLHNLTLTQETEDRVREQFRTALDQRDKTIRDLQEQLEATKNRVVDAESRRDDAERIASEALKESRAAAEQLGTSKELLAEKEKTTARLESQLTEYESKAKEYDALKEKADELQTKLDRAELEKENAVLRAKDELRDKLDEANARIRELENK